MDGGLNPLWHNECLYMGLEFTGDESAWKTGRSGGGDYYIQGWFQNERYFKEYENVIRNELRLKNKIKIQNKLREILDYSNTVAVHVRRGDYKKHCSVLPAEYYNRAVERINGLIDNPLFCIFSDEIEWVKKNMKFEGKCF